MLALPLAAIAFAVAPILRVVTPPPTCHRCAREVEVESWLSGHGQPPAGLDPESIAAIQRINRRLVDAA